MNKLFARIASITAGLALVVGAGVALASHAEAKGVSATDYSFTLTITSADLEILDSSQSSTYNKYKGDQTATAVCSTDASKNFDVTFNISDVMPGTGTNAGKIQFKASAGVLYNKTELGSISSVTWDGPTTIIGSSENPTTEVANGSYFVCKKDTKNAGYYSSIVVSFTKTIDDGGCTHDWEAVEVHAPTCTEAGYTEYECSLCHETKQGDPVAALGHDYGEVIVDTAATCTEAGAGHKVCSRDSSHVENVVIPATGHNFVNGVCTECGAAEPSETTITLDLSSGSTYGISGTQGDQTLTGDGATYGFEFKKGTGSGAKTYSGYVLFGKAGTYFRNTSAPANSYISAIGWKYSGNVSTNVQLSLSYGSNVLSAESSPITSFGKATTNGEVSLTQTDTTMSYFFIYVTNAYNCQFTSFTVTWSSKGGDTPADTYSVIYNASGSSTRPVEGMPSNVSGLEDGETYTLTGSPTRWGYTFLGWGASASATGTISSVTIDGADETVYALWQEDHTVAGAWSDSPYTVAQARTAIDDNEHLTDVYVAGIVSKVDSYNSTYKSVTYWISDDGTTTNQFEVYSGKGIDGADFSAVGDVEVGAQVVVNGDIKLYSSTYEFDKNNKQISYVGPSTGDIEVTFAPSNFLGVSDSGTYTASTDAENPTYSFSSTNSSVLSVASNGAYSAVSAGTATVRVDVTSSDGDGYKEVEVTVVEVKSVSEAYEIAAALSSGATTDYSIKVTGFVSSLDADGKARAINFTDGSQVIEVFFGGGNADYTTVTSTAFIGSKVTVFGKVQNYNGTYELKDITLGGVAAADANSYAAGAYKSLDGSCETGPAAVNENQWTAVSNGYSQLSAADQAKFREDDVTPYGENVVNWVDRYEIIVARTALNNFMSLANINGRYLPSSSTTVDSNVAIMVVTIVAITSISAIGVILVIKRRKAIR